METNLKYINLICTYLGGVGGHNLNIAGENEICTLLGGTGGHFLEINALNEICTIQGVTAGHSLNLSALSAIGATTYKTNLEAWKNIQEYTVLNHNEPETVALLARMTTQPDAARITIINDTIKELKTSGLFDLADVIRFHAGANEQAVLLNWKKDSHNAVKVGTPTIHADRGIEGTRTGYINSKFNAFSGGVNYSQDSATIALFKIKSENAIVVDCGAQMSTTSRRIMIGGGSNNFGRLHVSSVPSFTATYLPYSNTLFEIAVRSASNLVTKYLDGIQSYTYTTVSDTPPDLELFELANNSGGDVNLPSISIIGALYIGAKLTADQVIALNGIVKNYLIKVGAIKDFIGIIGDSTVAAYSGFNPVCTYLNDEYNYSAVHLATPADTINGQLLKWNALSAVTKLQFTKVMVQIGINDCNYTIPLATTLAKYQELIDKIKSEISATCKIVGCTLTPFRGRFDTLYTTNAPTAYANWLAINAAIKGEGATPFTKIDMVVSDHTTTMDAGDGYLAAIYDSGDGGHENDLGRAVVGAAWKAVIES